MSRPSPVQLMLLRRLAGMARDKQVVMRWPGGFWAPVGTPVNAHGEPIYFVGTQTVRAMERLGMLKQDLSRSAPEWARPRKLTTKGREYGAIAAWSGERQE